MALQTSFKLTETTDGTQAYLMDTTGAYSAGNTTGWGSPNSSVTDVVEVLLTGTFYPYPSSASPVTLSATLNNNQLYVLWQQYILTPALINFPYPDFLDGIYVLNIAVHTSIYTITQSGLDFPSEFAIGDSIRDVNNGNLLGVVQAVSVGTLVLTSIIVGHVFTPGDTLENQNSNTIATSGASSASFTNNIYIYTVQQEFTAVSDACIATNLNNANPFCDYCGDIDTLFKGFMTLQASKTLAGDSSNNAALDALQYLNTNFCNNGGC